MFGQGSEDFSGHVALQASHNLTLTQPFSRSPLHIGTRWFVVSHPDERDDVEGAVGRPIPTSIEAVSAGRPAAAGRLGETPQSLAKAASLRIRSVLSPAVMRNCAASSERHPK